MYEKTQQQLEVRKITEQVPWNLFVTLGFTKQMRVEHVSSALRVFFISVERSCYGRNQEFRLKRFPCIEQSDEATHVHLLMYKPVDYKSCDFKNLLARKWKKIRFSGWANLQQRELGLKPSWYQAVESDADRIRVSDYMTKRVSADYSSVDFVNTYIN